MDKKDTTKKVRDHILENYLFTTDDSALADDVSLMQTGVLDSTGILEIIMFLEESFELSVADEEMVPENLDSVVNIVEFVGRKNA